MAELRKQADEAAARMREFQEKHQIVDLDTQAKAVVSSVATLNAQRITKQMELDYARALHVRRRGVHEAARVAARRWWTTQLRDLEVPATDRRRRRRPGAGPKGSGLFPAALAGPEAAASEYEKLYRDRKVAEATLVFALDRLEGARASEARDVSTFVVLDPPTLPTRPARPPALPVLAVLGLAAGFVAGVGLEAWRSQGRPGLASLKQALGPRSEG